MPPRGSPHSSLHGNPGFAAHPTRRITHCPSSCSCPQKPDQAPAPTPPRYSTWVMATPSSASRISSTSPCRSPPKPRALCLSPLFQGSHSPPKGVSFLESHGGLSINTNCTPSCFRPPQVYLLRTSRSFFLFPQRQ